MLKFDLNRLVPNYEPPMGSRDPHNKTVVKAKLNEAKAELAKHTESGAVEVSEDRFEVVKDLQVGPKTYLAGTALDNDPETPDTLKTEEVVGKSGSLKRTDQIEVTPSPRPLSAILGNQRVDVLYTDEFAGGEKFAKSGNFRI